MRKVRYKSYTNGKYDEDFINEGLFHKWSVECVEFDTGGCPSAVAIIETPSGEIKTMYPQFIKFMDKAV